jgi:transcription elongation factor GreA
MSKPIIVTEEGYLKMKEELNFLKNEKRKEVADRLRESLKLGDLSENTEYQDAKEQQAFLEGSIVELEKKLKVVQVSDSSKNKSYMVHLGSTVTVSLDNNEETFFIVGATESSPFENKISNESPLGSALLGKKVNDKVNVEVNKKIMTYNIMDLK